MPCALSFESLYKALSGERIPDFDTILKVIGALGLKLHAEAPSGRLRPSTARQSAAQHRASLICGERSLDFLILRKFFQEQRNREVQGQSMPRQRAFLLRRH